MTALTKLWLYKTQLYTQLNIKNHAQNPAVRPCPQKIVISFVRGPSFFSGWRRHYKYKPSYFFFHLDFFWQFQWNLTFPVTKLSLLLVLPILECSLIQSGYEVSCRCHQIIDGKRYKVPCAWSDMPSCHQDYVPQIIPEYGSHCGVLSDENGAWQCVGSSCHLTCNHGYVPSDQGN